MLIGIDASRTVVARRTGTERYALEITRALVDVAPDDRFILYFNRPPPDGLLPRNARVRWRVIPAPRLWTVGRLSLEMLHHPPDVLFVPAHSLPLCPPPASVATIHDLGYLYFPGEHGSKRWLRHLANGWSARRASHVIAVSAATRDDLVRHYKIGAERISVVHHGVDPSFRPAASTRVAAVRERYGLECPYFLFVGTLQPRKNYGRLLAAFGKFVDDDSAKHRLALVGATGWQSDRLDRVLGTLGRRARDRVRRLGFVPDSDLPPLLTGAAGLVFPSLHEGFGLPALEAMACGAPVVASNTSSFPEVVGEAGLLVDPLSVTAITQGLARLATDAVLRGELRHRGLARAASFTWERAGHQTLDVLRRAAGASSPSS
jgi:glycosyltransferase involved in cell wall biosynthesis